MGRKNEKRKLKMSSEEYQSFKKRKKEKKQKGQRKGEQKGKVR